MNCNQAKQLIDEYVQAASESGDYAANESVELRAHLKACAACAKEYEELSSLRGKLAELSEDAPSDVELQDMWRAISPAITSQSTDVGAADDEATDDEAVDAEAPLKTRHSRRVLRYAAIITSIAAVLMISFRVGQWRYGEVESLMFSLLPSLSHATSNAEAPVRSALSARLEDERVSAQDKQRLFAGFGAIERSAVLADASSAEQSVTDEFWGLVRNGDVSVNEFLSSYGYQVPFGPSPSQPRDGADNRQVIAADRGPFYNSQDTSRSTIDVFTLRKEIPHGFVKLARWKKMTNRNYLWRLRRLWLRAIRCRIEFFTTFQEQVEVLGDRFLRPLLRIIRVKESLACLRLGRTLRRIFEGPPLKTHWPGWYRCLEHVSQR